MKPLTETAKRLLDFALRLERLSGSLLDDRSFIL